MLKIRSLAALSFAAALLFSGPLFAHPFSGQCAAYPKKLGEWIKAGEALKKAEAEKERAASAFSRALKNFKPLAKKCGPKEAGLANSAPPAEEPETSPAHFAEPENGEDGGWRSLASEDF